MYQKLMMTCLLFVSLLNASEGVDADRNLPPIFPLTVAPAATFKKPPVKSISMGNIVVQLEVTTLNDILSKIGTGKIQHRGDAAESVHWICYFIPSSASNARIWLMSGEIHGGTVGSIAVRLLSSDDTATPSCPTLPMKYSPIQFEQNIGLESKESDLRRTFGKPSLVANDWIHFDSEQEVMLNSKQFTELGSLSARMINDRIVELWVAKTTSR